MSLARVSRVPVWSSRRSDVAAAVLVGVPVIGSLIARAVRDNQPLVVLLAVAALAPVFLRRSRPLEALLLAVAVDAAMPDNGALLLPAMAVLYTIASRRSWSTATVVGLAAVVAAASISAGLAWGNVTLEGARDNSLLGHGIGTSAECAAAVALGLYVGARRRVMEALLERAERLDRERDLLADRAVAEERVRIAQELHDVVAHNVSLMVVQAQGLGATAGDDRVSKTTDAIADLGRQAMAEMHRTLRLLRAGETDAAQLAPQPGLANLDRLLEQSRAAGLDIELSVEGQRRALPQSVDLSAYRIIQEAVTNVLKHAAGAHTRITLSYRARDLLLTIVDSGDDTQRTEWGEPAAAGHGVIGMRERAALFGGTLTASPGPQRGFEVTVTLPYQEPAS